MLVQVPIASADVPFVFNEVTADFQDATIQGELTYRISDPKQIAALLDFSVDARGRGRSTDAEKLSDRLIHARARFSPAPSPNGHSRGVAGQFRCLGPGDRETQGV